LSDILTKVVCYSSQNVPNVLHAFFSTFNLFGYKELW